MKLVWESVMLAPVLLLLPVVQGQTCPGGIAGLNARDLVCCPLECGKCAGKGCTRRNGGASACCGGGIMATQGLCSETGKAPCNLVDPNPEYKTCPNGIEGIDGNGLVCCPVGCGECGGKGCPARPGGPDKCCGGAIMDSGVYCEDSGSAPCIIGSKSTDDSDDGYTGGEYGKDFSGDATYYGFTTAGNCAFFNDVPKQYDGMIPVALNAAQYGDSLMCGACIEGTSSGSGSGNTPIPSKFKAFVTDKCPECAKGDLDFSMSGDGRWDIDWKFVECPGEDLSFVSPSANPWYMKVQPRGTKTPVKTLKIAGKTATRTQDNHFVVHNSGSAWSGTPTIEIKTVADDSETTKWTFF